MGVRDWEKDARCDLVPFIKFNPSDTDRNAGRYQKNLVWVPHKVGACDYVEVVLAATTSGVTTTLSGYTNVHAIAVKAREANTDLVKLQWYQLKGTRAAGNLAITSATPDTLEDQDDGDWITTPTFAEAGDYAHLSAAAEDAGNQSTYNLIQSIGDKDATNDQIILAQDSTRTANADDDAAVVSIVRRNHILLRPGEVALLLGNDNIWPTGELVGTSRSGTQNLDLAIVKT